MKARPIPSCRHCPITTSRELNVHPSKVSTCDLSNVSGQSSSVGDFATLFANKSPSLYFVLLFSRNNKKTRKRQRHHFTRETCEGGVCGVLIRIHMEENSLECQCTEVCLYIPQLSSHYYNVVVCFPVLGGNENAPRFSS